MTTAPAPAAETGERKDWKEPPGETQQSRDFRSTDFKSLGNKTTWKAQCSGPPAMTGEGEIVRTSPDAYGDLLEFSSSMKLSGRPVGTCVVSQCACAALSP